MSIKYVDHLISIIYHKQKFINNSNLGTFDSFIWGFLCAVGNKLKEPVIVLNEIQYLNNKLDHHLITLNYKHQEFVKLCQASFDKSDALDESISTAEFKISNENLDCNSAEADLKKFNSRLKKKLQFYEFNHKPNDVRSHNLKIELNNTSAFSDLNKTISKIHDTTKINNRFNENEISSESIIDSNSNNDQKSIGKSNLTLNNPLFNSHDDNGEWGESGHFELELSAIKNTKHKCDELSKSEFMDSSMAICFNPQDMIRKFGFLKSYVD